jgi:formylglycine-generating enzyme required for sulfatase activity
MTKLFFILLVSCLGFTPCWAQTSTRQETNYSTGQTPKSSAIPLEVLFATNEDCDLYINGQFKSTITKSAHKYLKLAPGTYSYMAKGRTTAGEFTERFVVQEGKPNEVFIDLLYYIDLSNIQKANARPVAATTANVNKKAVTAKTATDELSGEQVIQALSSNMISINGGSFIMGNNKAPAEDEVEHTVTIGAVLFSKYEVTQAQWGAVMGYNPSENKGCNNCPVENISWEEAVKFVRKLNSMSGKKFRLPTEAEWEFVARMGGKEEIEKAGGQEEYIKKAAWFYGNANKKTHPVGLKLPTVLGIYDLYGNVSEWCYDWYSPDYFKEENNQMDPDGPPLGKEKVFRGANFEDYAGDRFRPSLRNKTKPNNKSKTIGLRLVMDI